MDMNIVKLIVEFIYKEMFMQAWAWWHRQYFLRRHLDG